MSLQVVESRAGEGLGPFLRVAHEVYRNDPSWVAPLDLEIRDRLTPRKNPFFEHGEAALFVARRGRRLVGRCSAQIDHRHLEHHQDQTGFFGFLDTVEDEEVARALLARAEAWLRERGMKRMRGPYSLNINEELGCLVEGFEYPPMIMMSHSRPYQGRLIEAAGLSKAKDLLAWRYDVGAVHRRADRAWAELQEMPEVQFRSVRKEDMERELHAIMDVFNEAWHENWGFVPATQAEVEKVASDMKLIIDEDLAFIAEVEGRAVGICVCLPNLNEAIYDLNGKLFPLGLPKLLWRMKVKRLKSARLMMLGIRPEYRKQKRYGGLSLAMYVELSKRGIAKGYRWGELSWTLEDNHPVNLGIKAMGARVYKKYRLYEKELAS